MYTFIIGNITKYLVRIFTIKNSILLIESLKISKNDFRSERRGANAMIYILSKEQERIKFDFIEVLFQAIIPNQYKSLLLKITKRKDQINFCRSKFR